MTEELLHHTNIRAIPEQQRRHRVAQHVRSHVPPDTRLPAQLGDDVSNPLGREPSAIGVDEQCRTLRLYMRPRRHVCKLDLHRLLVDDESQPVTASLALYPENRFPREVVPNVEGRGLAYANACGEKEVYEREIAERPVVARRGFPVSGVCRQL